MKCLVFYYKTFTELRKKSTISRQKPITYHGRNGLLIKVYSRPVTKFLGCIRDLMALSAENSATMKPL